MVRHDRSDGSLMCGRFVLRSDKNQLADHYGLAAVPAYSAGYNIAPSAQVPVIRYHPDRELAVCQWEFVPHWVKDPARKPINARAETLERKPYFRDAFRQRRCLIPANGYYEWQVEGGRKQPYFIRMAESALFSFAGLWSSWRGPNGPVESCAIITTAAAEALTDIHDRMPAIIEPDNYDIWLNKGGEALLGPCAAKMEAYPVSTRVNNPRHQGEVLIQPLS